MKRQRHLFTGAADEKRISGWPPATTIPDRADDEGDGRSHSFIRCLSAASTNEAGCTPPSSSTTNTAARPAPTCGGTGW